MKYLVVLALLIATSFSMFAQDSAPVVDKKKHKVVFQLTTNDTLHQKSLVKQIHNILTAAPNTSIEVVCHNNGITFLMTAQTKQGEKIHELSDKGVVFVACENTMRERKIKKEELVKEAGTVASGVLEVIKKQEKKWAYIKAG